MTAQITSYKIISEENHLSGKLIGKTYVMYKENLQANNSKS